MADRPQRSVYTSNPYPSKRHPFVERAEVVTSRASSVQAFGEPLHINILVNHNAPMINGSLGVQIVNQSQVPVAALYAYPPAHKFGQNPGQTLVQFSIPSLRTNIGRFHLKTFLSELPTGSVYEILDDICDFEVVRHDFYPWWSPETCTYHEDFRVRVSNQQEPSEPAGTLTQTMASLP